MGRDRGLRCTRLPNRFVCNLQNICGMAATVIHEIPASLQRELGKLCILSNLAWTSRMQSTKIILLISSKHVARFNASIKTILIRDASVVIAAAEWEDEWMTPVSNKNETNSDNTTHSILETISCTHFFFWQVYHQQIPPPSFAKWMIAFSCSYCCFFASSNLSASYFHRHSANAKNL